MILDFAPQDAHAYISTMYGLLEKLAAGVLLQPGPIKEYRFAGDVRAGQALRLGFPKEHPAWTPFTPELQQRLPLLGATVDSVPTGWSYDTYAAADGFIGELATPITSV